jgi:5-methylcytosine-specific restriction enzyme subunit McrC
MLLYAWDRVWHADLLDVAELEKCHTVKQLLTRILLNAAKSVLKRGLDQGYVENTESLQQLRGQVNFTGSLQAISKNTLALVCNYEVFDSDIVQNQIVKSIIEMLFRSSDQDLDAALISELELLHFRMKSISSIKLKETIFRTVQLHSNNGLYRLLLSVCLLIYRNILVSEDSGNIKFLDCIHNTRQMHGLFEDFLRNFYKLRQHNFDVRSQRLQFGANLATIIPEMQTDISLVNSDRVIIVDAKFYQNIFQETRFGQKKLRNAHLNQLHAYLSAYERTYNRKAEGMLIYAEGSDFVCHTEQILGYTHSYKSIDLLQEWSLIEEDLLSFLN